MAAPLNILLVRPWTLDTERIRTSLRAAGLTVRILRIDFPAALYAALSWTTFDVVLYDPTTSGISPDLLATALRDHPTAPVIEIGPSMDIGALVKIALDGRRN